MVKAVELQQCKDARRLYLRPQCLVSISGEGCFPCWALTSLFCTAPDPERPLNKHSGLSEARGQQPGPEPGGQGAAKRSGNSPFHPWAQHTVRISPPPRPEQRSSAALQTNSCQQAQGRIAQTPHQGVRAAGALPGRPASRMSSPRTSSTPPPLPSCPNIRLLAFVSDYAEASFLLLSPPLLIC